MPSSNEPFVVNEQSNGFIVGGNGLMHGSDRCNDSPSDSSINPKSVAGVISSIAIGTNWLTAFTFLAPRFDFVVVFVAAGPAAIRLARFFVAAVVAAFAGVAFFGLRFFGVLLLVDVFTGGCSL